MSDVLFRVTKVLREVLDEEDLVVDAATTPETVEGWDSVAHVKLFLALESEFDVAFSPDELASIKSVGDILTALAEQGIGEPPA